MPSHAEDWFARLLDEWGFVGYEREYRFSPTRKWRFDFAWPRLKLAVELHGGMYRYLPSHASAKRNIQTMEKLNEAQLHGWLVLQVPTHHLDGKGRLRDVQTMLVRAAEVASAGRTCASCTQADDE